MKRSQLAAQLYTVREHCQDARAFATTAHKIRAIGYRAVQLSGIGPISEAEIGAILKAEALSICATHEAAADILDHPERCIERLRRIGCSMTAFPWPAGVNFGNPEEIRTLARRLDSAGAMFHAAGLKLGYHNHAIEFVKLDAMTALEYIYAHTQPHHLVAELDTYWVHYGGGDVVRWCERLDGRLPLLHMKDYGFTPQNMPTWCEVGTGTFDWRQIVAAAERSGCEWYIVEQDTCPGDPFESLKMSYDYLVANVCEA